MLNLSWIGGSKEPEYEEKNRVSSYKGYLQKLRRSENVLAPKWGKRWFSIEGRRLNWYRQESDSIPSGMISLKYVKYISKMESSGSGTSFKFLISCPDRDLILKCDTMQEMNNWIRALHIHADIARGGDGMNIVSNFNEEPMRFQGMNSIKRNGKMRSSLTLEQELDLNLKKLDALEKEVLSPPQESKSESSVSQEEVINTTTNKKKPFYPKVPYNNQYHNNNNMGNNNNENFNGRANIVNRHDVLAEEEHVDINQQSSNNISNNLSRENSGRFRADSNTSIENISIAHNTRVIPSRRALSSSNVKNSQIGSEICATDTKNNDANRGHLKSRGNSGKSQLYSYESGESDQDQPYMSRHHADFEIIKEGETTRDRLDVKPLGTSTLESFSHDSDDGFADANGTFRYEPQVQQVDLGSVSSPRISGRGVSSSSSASRSPTTNRGSSGKLQNTNTTSNDKTNSQRRLSAEKIVMNSSRSATTLGDKNVGSAKTAWENDT